MKLSSMPRGVAGHDRPAGKGEITMKRTLTGAEALAAALLREEGTCLLDGAPAELESARVASYDRPEAVTYAWEPVARGWTHGHIERLAAGRSAADRASRTGSDRRYASREEYAAAALLAAEERCLYEAQTEALRAANWRPAQEIGRWYEVDMTTGRARRNNGRVVTRTRAEVLEALAGRPTP